MESFDIEQFLHNENEKEKERKNLEAWLNGLPDGWYTKKKNECLSIEECIKNHTKTPETKNIFRALTFFKPEDTNVIIIGQDPYPKQAKACGLAFLHNPEYKENKGVDASLSNILEAIDKRTIKKGRNIEYDKNETDKNKRWAEANKVLLLNTALTYENYEAKKDHQAAWKDFITEIIKKVLKTEGKLVVFLWGGDAQVFFHNITEEMVENKNKEIKREMLVLATSHPSPNRDAYKRGFITEAPVHFQVCNEFLGEKNAVDWEELRKIYPNKDNK